MTAKSIWAVAAGAFTAIVLTTVIDVVLHATGVYPGVREPIDDSLALLASSYRFVIGIGAAWLTARLAPHSPMKHVIILGVIGSIVALIGVFATWKLNLGPHWYPISLVVLSIPECWIGGKLFTMRSAAQVLAA